MPRTLNNGRSARQQTRFIDKLARHFITHASDANRRRFARMERRAPDFMIQVRARILEIKRSR